uniref:Uncharacterized protein n=1 Tax=Moniliophthora roreri TaxID=221103 RepID=A0A0W0FQN7_MONRR
MSMWLTGDVSGMPKMIVKDVIPQSNSGIGFVQNRNSVVSQTFGIRNHQQLTVMGDFIKYDGQDTIIRQGLTTFISNPGDLALYKAIDLHFVEYEWVLIANLENDAGSLATYEQEYRVGLQFTSGSEYDAPWNISAEFSGLNFGYQQINKVFSKSETSTQGATFKAGVTVGPNSRAYLYQKRYKFRPEVWFLLDAWAKMWAVGQLQVNRPLTRSAVVVIDSDEYRSSSYALSAKDGVVCADIVTPDKIYTQANIKQFQDVPAKARNYLRDRGINGGLIAGSGPALGIIDDMVNGNAVGGIAGGLGGAIGLGDNGEEDQQNSLFGLEHPLEERQSPGVVLSNVLGGDNTPIDGALGGIQPSREVHVALDVLN